MHVWDSAHIHTNTHHMVMLKDTHIPNNPIILKLINTFPHKHPVEI